MSKLTYEIVSRTPSRTPAAAVVALLLATAAPAARGGVSRAVIAPDEWSAVMEERGVDPALFDNPLAVTPEMERAAREQAGDGSTTARLDRLQQSLFDASRYTFEYDSDHTLTAEEAFAAKRGNCVSFVNLFIALARSLGIPVRPAIQRSVRDVAIEDDLMVINTHLVAAYEGAKHATIFDFYRSRADAPVAVRLLDDFDLNAIYLSNLGVERLREDELDAALEYFEAAIRLSPEFAEAYANLGVARRRKGDAQGALDAYFGGLAIDPDNPRLLHNLTSLYRARAIEKGKSSDARPSGDAPVSALEVVERADADLANGRTERALELYRRAHRIDPRIAAPLVGIARMQVLRGNPGKARETLREALELDPDDPEARELLTYLDR